jgi:hypothetical protein
MRSPSSSRAFIALLISGLVVEALAASLAYSWAARVLPCRFSPAQAVFGRSYACPVPGLPQLVGKMRLLLVHRGWSGA